MPLLVVFALAGCGSDWNDRWETRDGTSVDETVVASGTRCADEQTVLLDLGWPLGRSWLRGGEMRQYIRDPGGSVPIGEEGGPIVTSGQGFDPDAKLPASARFSGYDRGEARLWIAADSRKFVYLVFDDRVERWPRVPVPIGCA